ncbi:MAG TPA: hypothetical protein VFQ12_08865 [Thermoleophilaceae bacterium]|nr:hypothetical protein [Thermoleophilaceae bacterium]
MIAQARAGASPATRERLVHAAVLAVPFLVAIAVLRGLTVEIDTFHASDAADYHLPTILQFAEHLDLERYPAAQTPLYHLLFAGFGEVAGFELWKLRLLNAAISYGAALTLLRLLRRSTPLEPVQALALTLVFTLSPYFFGASFTLLTDNLALLFTFVALERIDAFRRSGSLGVFAMACAALAGASLTRQSFLWLVPVAAWFLVRAPVPLSRKAGGAGLLALAVAPIAALVVTWGALVPKGSDPASCGLCGDRPGMDGETSVSLRTVGFVVALLGAYATVLYGPSLLRRVRALPRPPVPLVGLGAALAAAVVLLAAEPLVYQPVAPNVGDAGYLWKLADRLPEVAGSSLLLLGLVPLGTVAVYLLARRDGWLSLPAVVLWCFLLAALPVKLVYQKYFDPMVLVALALLARPGDLRSRGDYLGVAVLCVAFVAYALSFA